MLLRSEALNKPICTTEASLAEQCCHLCPDPTSWRSACPSTKPDALITRLARTAMLWRYLSSHCSLPDPCLMQVLLIGGTRTDLHSRCKNNSVFSYRKGTHIWWGKKMIVETMSTKKAFGQSMHSVLPHFQLSLLSPRVSSSFRSNWLYYECS